MTCKDPGSGVGQMQINTHWAISKFDLQALIKKENGKSNYFQDFPQDPPLFLVKSRVSFFSPKNSSIIPPPFEKFAYGYIHVLSRGGVETALKSEVESRIPILQYNIA